MSVENLEKLGKDSGDLPSETLKKEIRSSVGEIVSKSSFMEEFKSSYNTLLKQLPKEYKKLLEDFYKRICKKKITLGNISQMMFEINNFLDNFKGKDFYDSVRNFCKIFYDSVNEHLDTLNTMELDMSFDASSVECDWYELGDMLRYGYTMGRGEVN